MKDQITLKNINEEVFRPFKKEIETSRFDGLFSINNPDLFKSKVLEYARRFDKACILNNNSKSPHNKSDFIAALGVRHELIIEHADGAFKSIKNYLEKHKGQWVFSALSYDLKNDVEDLSSDNNDEISFPLAHLFLPEIIVVISENELKILCHDLTASDIFNNISTIELDNIESHEVEENQFNSKPNKRDYISTINSLIEEIKYGNIYEINYCKELSAKLDIDPFRTAETLFNKSPAPFSAFYKNEDSYLMCASPERFLLKYGNTLLSQPIKGTKKRSTDPIKDQKLKEDLLSDTKERAENVMIVDLVRNDLSKSAETGSVEVSELFGIYSFPQVHQMISTVTSKLKKEVHFSEALQYCFPMGSMTGAPKLRAMKLIEKHESFKRGMFSGTIGLISPNGNFDFNVVIRSILFNDKSKKISIRTGSAITALCDPMKEWEECELKARVLMNSVCLNKP